MMKANDLIIAKDHYYSMDCYETQLNNNVLVVGTSGSGKTRSIVSPNILQACGSYIISDPKGNLHRKYKQYLVSQGYVVKKLDFTHPQESMKYNPFHYINCLIECAILFSDRSNLQLCTRIQFFLYTVLLNLMLIT